MPGSATARRPPQWGGGGRLETQIDGLVTTPTLVPMGEMATTGVGAWR